MVKFILARKLGMSQLFADNGDVVPVTLLEALPSVVLQVKTKEKDGYEALQFGAGTRNPSRIAKPQKGHMKTLGSFRYIREVRSATFDGKELKVGDMVDASKFSAGEAIRVSGVTKGRGFAGAMKRHGFHGGPASHGHKSVRRRVGSIGQRFPQHTFKGTRMAGRMGGERLSVRGLRIEHVDLDAGVLAVRGAVPGARGGLVEIITIG